jgi:hypothetical protein
MLDVAISADSSSDAAHSCADAGGGTWNTQPVETDSHPDGGTLMNAIPQLGFDGSGNAIVIWEQNDRVSGLWSVWANRRAADGTWGSPQAISMNWNENGISAVPQIAVSANGSVVAVWQQVGANGALPWANTYSPGTGWGTATALQMVQATVAGVRDPHIAIDSQGNAVAIWSQALNVFNEVYADRYTPGSGWGGPVKLLPPANGLGGGLQDANDATVAVDESGDAFAAWGQTVANVGDRVLGARYDKISGMWSTPVFLDSLDACDANCLSNKAPTPQIAADLNRNAVVVWQQQVVQANGMRPWAAHYTQASASWSATPDLLDVNLMSVQNTDVPRLAIDRAGNALAVWQQTVNIGDRYQNQIVTNYFTGGAWKGAVGVDGVHPGASNLRPAVAFDDNGDAFVIWDDQASVWAAWFSGSSASFSSETEIHQGVSAAYSEVAFGHGCPSALAAWQSFDGQSTGSEGIFSLLFH